MTPPDRSPSPRFHRAGTRRRRESDQTRSTRLVANAVDPHQETTLFQTRRSRLSLRSIAGFWWTAAGNFHPLSFFHEERGRDILNLRVRGLVVTFTCHRRFDLDLDARSARSHRHRHSPREPAIAHRNSRDVSTATVP